MLKSASKGLKSTGLKTKKKKRRMLSKNQLKRRMPNHLNGKERNLKRNMRLLRKRKRVKKSLKRKNP